MRWFYPVALITVLVLVLSPMAFLGKELKRENYPGVNLWDVNAADVKSLDPATCGDNVSSAMQGSIYEGPFSYHYLKRPYEVIPLLASDMPTVSSDGTTYTIRIKSGVLYQRNACFGKTADGTKRFATRAVVAEDFVLAYKRIADYHINTGLAWAFFAGRIVGLDLFREKTKRYAAGDFSRYDLAVDGLSAPNDSTLVIQLTEPFPQFVYVLAMPVYAPIPRELVDYWLTSTDDGKGGRMPLALHLRNPEILEPAAVIGTGPYALETFKRKWRVVLTRNPDFRPSFYPCEGEPDDSALGLLADCGKQIPFIDRISWQFMDEEYAAWMLFLSRQRDAAFIPRENFNNVVTPGQALTDEWQKRGIKLRTFSDPTVFWIVFNMEDSILGASKALRQAISLSYDSQSEIEVLRNGRGTRAINILPTDFDGREQAGPSPYLRFDLDAARAKLDEAKRELAAKGLLVNGEIPEIRFDMSDGVVSMRMAEFAQQQFAQIGLKIKPIYNDWPTLQRKTNNRQSQMFTMGWGADYPDAENFLQLYYSGNIDKGTNTSGYRNRTYDSLYLAARVMQDSPERTGLYVRMVRMISEDCPVLPIFEPTYFIVHYPWISNVKQHPILQSIVMYRRIDTTMRAAAGGRN